MSKANPSIVFTGSGLVCGAGSSVAEVWARLISGETSVTAHERWDTANWGTKVAAEVTLTPRDLVSDRKLHKSIARTDMMGIYASEQALENSGVLAQREGLGEAEVNAFNDRTGFIVGSGGGTYTSNYDYLGLMHETACDLPAFGRELANYVTPMWLLQNLPNNVLCHVGIRQQLKGTNACITNQCAGSVLAVAEAALAVATGEADRALATGHDTPFEPEMVLYYHKLGLLSDATPRPFDQSRSGTIFGEGAGAVMIEHREDAAARGANILGEFLGFACVSEATGILDLDADGEGVSRAITEALAQAGIGAADVGMICAHGNGTPASDLTEALGIKRVFGGSIPPVTGFKWAYGHLIGAAGIVDLVMTLEALRQGIVPGIPTLGELDHRIAPFPVSATPTAPRSNIALLICRAFGGLNVVLVVKGAS
jgi:3-oxoacyl-(acyl-carrier-protein) synthase